MWVNITYKLVWFAWLGVGAAFLQSKTSFPEIRLEVMRSSAGAGLLQETTIMKGVILDEETKRPISYANVVLVKSKRSAQTNNSGEFTLQLPDYSDQESIKILSLGYITKTIPVADLLRGNSRTNEFTIYLKPKYESLGAVEISARSRKWKIRKVGFNIDKGTRFHHQFSPLDTVVEKTGQEITNNFELRKYPAHLQSISFGLAGSGNVKAIIGLRIYSLKNNKPDKPLSESIILRIPPHHTGWITADLKQYSITLKDDFAVAVEWLSDTNKLNKSSLLAFAKHPKDQITFYRNSDQEPWELQQPTLTKINSIGLYVTVLN